MPTVYDQDITVVDSTNLLYLGVTVALAWPLPIQPFYPNSDFDNQITENNLLTKQIQNKNDLTTIKTPISTPILPYTKSDKQTIIDMLRRHYEKIVERTKTNLNVTNMNYVNNYNSDSTKNHKNNNHYYSDGTYYASPMAPFGPKVWQNDLTSNYTNIDRRKDVFYVRPPLSPTYQLNNEKRYSNHYDLFANYLLETYFDAWTNVSWNDEFV